jgi:transcriptional regulator with XRE-family HTH domain
MTPQELAAQQVEQVARALRQRIRGTGRTQREVEQSLGMGKDYLRQLLSGNMDLKLKHLFGILAVLGEEPTEFVATVFGLPPALLQPEPIHPLFRESMTAAQRSVLPLLIESLREKGVLSQAEAGAMLATLEPDPPRR